MDICLQIISDFFHHMMQLQRFLDFNTTSGSEINMLGHVNVISLPYYYNLLERTGEKVYTVQ